MSVLILSNSAPNYHFFFNSLAENFSSNGEKVVYAVDCQYSRINNYVDDFSDLIYVFSDFFSSHEIDDSKLNEYYEYNLNYALISDFERAEVYNIWGNKQFENDYLRKLKSALLNFFENIIEDHRISLVVYENVSNTFSYFAYIVASKKGVNYKGFIGSRLPGRFEISEGPFDFAKVKATFNQITSGELVVSEEVKSVVESYIQRIEKIEPDYMALNKLSDVGVAKRYLSFEKLNKVISLLRYSFSKADWDFQIGNPLKTHINLFLRNLMRSFKCRILKKHYESFDVECQYFLYPLHFHPESSTSILSGNNLDEYEVIKSIAFNLPEETILYIKDHKSSWGYPSLKFYKRLRRLPNVKLLSPYEPTKELIKDSAGVVTLTSTVGYEALLLGKRVLLIGRVFYEFHKNVEILKSRDDIFSALKQFLDSGVDDVQEYNRQFVQAYWLSTYSGTLNLLNTNHLNKDSASYLCSVLREE
jgi:hypothetical protein